MKIQGSCMGLSLGRDSSLAASLSRALNLALALSLDLTFPLALALARLGLLTLVARWLLIGARVVQQAVQQAVAGRLRHATVRRCLVVLPA